jgi:hypothetical protein
MIPSTPKIPRTPPTTAAKLSGLPETIEEQASGADTSEFNDTFESVDDDQEMMLDHNETTDRSTTPVPVEALHPPGQINWQTAYTDLAAQLAGLKNQNAALQRSIEKLKGSAGSSGSLSNPSPRLKMKEPTAFTGKRSDARIFLFTCELNLGAMTGMLTLTYKINYVVSFLQGDAMRWYQYQVHRPGKVFFDFEEFKRFFLARFGEDETLSETAANHALARLKQTTSVDNYFTEFSRLVSHTDHPEKTQISLFRANLKPKMLKFLAGLQSQPTSLSELVQTCINYDEQIQAVERQEQQQQYRSRGRSQDTHREANVSTVKVKRALSQAPSHSERRRRRELGLCRYCGKDDCAGAKLLENCPALIAKNAKAPLGKASQQ